MSENKVTSSVLAGFFVGLVLIVYTIVTYFTGLYTESWNQWVGIILFAAGIIFAVINHGKERDNKVTFGNLFGFGFKIVAVVTILLIAYTMLFYWLFPDAKEKFLEIMRENAIKQKPDADEQSIDSLVEMYRNRFTLIITISLLFSNLVGGLLASLLGAAFAKKDGSDSPFENS